MTPRDLEEYRALRDTIRERGTARVWIFLAGVVAWAATLVIALSSGRAFAAALPPVILAATFEAVFALHTGVERIGRYIQVFFEGHEADPGWETRIMRFGQAGPGVARSRLLAGSGDPLFTAVFCAAALLGVAGATTAVGRPVWAQSLAALLNALVGARALAARRQAGRQRAEDLERFRQLN